MDLQIHQLDTDEALATLGHVVIRVVNGAQTTTATMDAIRAAIDEVLERSPLAGIWIVVHHGSPSPDAEVRRYAGRLLAEDSERQVVVYSLLGLGFWAAAAISVSTILAKVMRQPALIESTLEAGAQRLALEMIGVDPAKLVEAHDELLRRMRINTAVA